jgi:cytochrome c peroxidase
MDFSIDHAAARVGVSSELLARALATYVRSITSGNAPYDRFVNGDRDALSDEAQIGLGVFRGKGNCTACHLGPTLTDEQFHNTGIAWNGSGTFLDEGRGAVTRNPEDRGAFKTPTLRELERSAPYMHDGSFRSLEEVIDYYDRGANRHSHLDRELRPLGLTALEKRGLIAFLRSLSGEVSR